MRTKCKNKISTSNVSLDVKEFPFSKNDIKEIVKERFNFCRTELGLSKKDARECANRALQAIEMTKKDFGVE
jgi:hypothetical protein